MIRPDFAARRKSTGTPTVFDFKSMSGSLDADQLQHSLQLYINMKGVERRLGEPVLDYYLIGLAKGSRKRERNPETGKYDVGLRKQDSRLCYAYHSPAAPPLQRAEWSWEVRRGKGWGKIPIWEGHFPLRPAASSNVEHWVLDIASDDEIGGVLELLGPCQRPDLAMGDVLQQIHAHAVRIANPWLNAAGMDVQGPAKIDLDAQAPQSWKCSDVFGHDCEFKPICFKHAGWEDPIGSGKFEPRKPHHALEAELLRAGGIR
jgi:hypothetical protein